MYGTNDVNPLVARCACEAAPSVHYPDYSENQLKTIDESVSGAEITLCCMVYALLLGVLGRTSVRQSSAQQASRACVRGLNAVSLGNI